jgi:hypothetical protein
VTILLVLSVRWSCSFIGFDVDIVRLPADCLENWATGLFPGEKYTPKTIDHNSVRRGAVNF